MATTILNHALIDHKLTIMRDKDTKTIVFKDNRRNCNVNGL